MLRLQFGCPSHVVIDQVVRWRGERHDGCSGSPRHDRGQKGVACIVSEAERERSHDVVASNQLKRYPVVSAPTGNGPYAGLRPIRAIFGEKLTEFLRQQTTSQELHERDFSPAAWPGDQEQMTLLLRVHASTVVVVNADEPGSVGERVDQNSTTELVASCDAVSSGARQ